jgi:hypothetical protein
MISCNASWTTKYWEMAKSMGFPKLKAGLCAMTKADLADSLAYNSLKVQK